MKEVQIRFRYKGVEYTGELSSVMGAASTTVYHLSVNKFFWGRLRMANDKWVFDPTPKTSGMEALAEWMGSKVSA
jgi:hypothetical protein